MLKILSSQDYYYIQQNILNTFSKLGMIQVIVIEEIAKRLFERRENISSDIENAFSSKVNGLLNLLPFVSENNQNSILAELVAYVTNEQFAQISNLIYQRDSVLSRLQFLVAFIKTRPDFIKKELLSIIHDEKRYRNPKIKEKHIYGNYLRFLLSITKKVEHKARREEILSLLIALIPNNELLFLLKTQDIKSDDRKISRDLMVWCHR